MTQTNHDMFCPGTAFLEDGRLLVNGGGPDVTTTSIYDFSGNQWVRGASMSRRRWYNASTTLPGGGVFTLGGIPEDGVGELWTAGAGWSVLAGAPVTPMTVDAGSICHAASSIQRCWWHRTASCSPRAPRPICNGMTPPAAGVSGSPAVAAMTSTHRTTSR